MRLLAGLFSCSFVIISSGCAAKKDKKSRDLSTTASSLILPESELKNYQSEQNELQDAKEHWGLKRRNIQASCGPMLPANDRQGLSAFCKNMMQMYDAEMKLVADSEQSVKSIRTRLRMEPGSNEGLVPKVPGCYAFTGQSQLYAQPEDNSSFDPGSRVGDGSATVYVYLHSLEDMKFYQITVKSGALEGKEGYMRAYVSPRFVPAPGAKCI